MIMEEDYSRMSDHRDPEIIRIPIHEQILELINSGLDPYEVLKDSVPGYDINRKVEDSIEVLKGLGMIGPDGTITEMGRFSPRYPLSVRNSAVLYYAVVKDQLIFPYVVVLALIDSYGPSYFSYPPRSEEQSDNEYNEFRENHRYKYFRKYEGRDDMETFIYMWDDMIKSVGGWNVIDPKNTNRRQGYTRLHEWAHQIKHIHSSMNISDSLLT